jgi:hypothetical protein
MNLSAHWHYIEDIARRRLEHNKTENHISRYGSQIEVLGAAGELAALLVVPGPGETLVVGTIHGRSVFPCGEAQDIDEWILGESKPIDVIKW